MTFQTELSSWLSPSYVKTSAIPKQGDTAPESNRIPKGRVIVTFLRHCGCPFAERTFVNMRRAAETSDVTFVAVSHSNEEASQKWLRDVGGPGKVQFIVDETRELYALYGLGVSSFWHVLNPWSMGSVFSLAMEGTTNRPTESGSRWQTSGTYVIKDETIVVSQPAKAADDIPDFDVLAKMLD
jgi:hypothetical protein